MKKTKNKKALLSILGVAVLLIIILVAGLVYMYTTTSTIVENAYRLNNGFAITVDVDGEELSINSWKNIKDKKSYVFLPADADASRVKFDSADVVSVDGNSVASGEYIDTFSSLGEYKLNINGEGVSVVFLQSENVPSVHIDTDDNYMELTASKENKLPAQIKIFDNGESVIDTELKHIKGRGNASWSDPQKSFNIKFNEKTDLFDMGEAKKYSLISTFNDQTLIKNNVAFELADEIGLKHTSKYQQIDLYIDNSYLGSYLLVESVEVGKHRVSIHNLEDENELANPDFNIEDASLMTDAEDINSVQNSTIRWADIPNSPSDISKGYLLEVDADSRYLSEPSGFVTSRGQAVVINSPEYATKEEVEYISSLYQEFEDAAYSSDGYNEQGKYYLDYIDSEAFAQMYLVEELAGNRDANLTSTHFYLGKSGRFNAGPVWDFDNAFGKKVSLVDMNKADAVRPDEWTAAFSKANRNHLGIFTMLIAHSDFRAVVNDVWTSELKLELEELALINDSKTQLVDSAVMNGIRWDRYKTTDIEENKLAYTNALDELQSYIDARISLFDSTLSSYNTIAYLPNGANVVTGQGSCVPTGENATIIDNPYISDRKFLGWNTMPDGSGDSYSAGDEINLTGDIQLYAQWSDSKSPILKLKNKVNSIKKTVSESIEYRYKLLRG